MHDCVNSCDHHCLFQNIVHNWHKNGDNNCGLVPVAKPKPIVLVWSGWFGLVEAYQTGRSNTTWGPIAKPMHAASLTSYTASCAWYNLPVQLFLSHASLCFSPSQSLPFFCHLNLLFSLATYIGPLTLNLTVFFLYPPLSFPSQSSVSFPLLFLLSSSSSVSCPFCFFLPHSTSVSFPFCLSKLLEKIVQIMFQIL